MMKILSGSKLTRGGSKLTHPGENGPRVKYFITRMCHPQFFNVLSITFLSNSCSYPNVPQISDLKKKKDFCNTNIIIHVFGTLHKNKAKIPLKMQHNNARPERSSVFGFSGNLTMVSYALLMAA